MAGSAAWVLAVLAVLQAGTTTAPPKAGTVELTRLAFDISDGAIYETVQAGLLCVFQQHRRWQGPPVTDALASYRAAFRTEAARAGLSQAGGPDDLFATETTPPAYAVGAVVSALRQRTCQVNGFTGVESSVKGEAAMTVRWQVFSRATGQVAARFETQADATISKSVPGGAGRLAAAAFAANAAKLIGLEGFRRTVGVTAP